MPIISQLRPITQKLNALPVKDLPRIANFLASSITSCSHILSNPPTQNTVGSNDDAVLIHKLRTRISSLLQDRTPEGRWTAIILVKAVIEAGGWETLKDCEAWSRSLLSILGKSDPVSTKKLSVITLTRIFLLTRPYPTLIREITTPLLPSFISSCLNLVSRKDSSTSKVHVKAASLLPSVLESFNLLLLHHPTTFRPFSARIHELLLTLLTDSTVSADAKGQARDLFASLHYCAAKNAATSEWEGACKSLIASVHSSADQLFRAIIEDWDSSDEQRRQISTRHNYDEIVASLDSDPLGLPAWEGIHDGAMHIVELIGLLSTFLSKSTMSMVSVPIGLILDLTARVCSVLMPQQGKDSRGPRHNPEVGKEEREELFSYIPLIHLATLDLFSSLTDATQEVGMPVYPAILDQASWVFGAEFELSEIRFATFRLVGQLLPYIGPSVTKAEIRALTPILRACARDLMPLEKGQSLENGASKDTKSSRGTIANADNFLKVTKSSTNQLQPQVLPPEAWQLLPGIFQFLPSNLMNQSVRGELDRAAILSAHKVALLASTLNPPPLIRGKPAPASLLPWLSHISCNDLSYEGFLRPRMPIVSREPNKASDPTNEDTDMDDAFSTAMPWERSIEENPDMGEAPSLLDQVENALPAVNATAPNTSNGTSTTSNPTVHASSPQKRAFTQLEPKISPSSSAPQPANTSSASHDSSKRLKPSIDSIIRETAPAIASESTPLGTTSAKPASTVTLQAPDIMTENVAPLTSTTIPPAPAVQELVSPMNNGAAVAPPDPKERSGGNMGEEEEESDFEMPEINVDPDTDDELEDEDDDGDE